MRVVTVVLTTWITLLMVVIFLNVRSVYDSVIALAVCAAIVATAVVGAAIIVAFVTERGDAARRRREPTEVIDTTGDDQ
jgi:uncharacterized membrane protein